MQQEQRRHIRKKACGNITIQPLPSESTYTVSFRDVSKSGACIHSLFLPDPGEKISFEIVDEYGLNMLTGQGKVVRIMDTPLEADSGFAICFDEELDMAMVDYLCAVRIEETI